MGLVHGQKGSDMKRLDQGIKIQHCLVAKSGDCAAGGLGDSNDVLPFDDKHKQSICEFLYAQLDWQIHAQYYASMWDNAGREKLDRLHASGAILTHAGVFQHKWHERTQWELVPYNREELAHYQPWKLGNDMDSKSI